MCGLPSACRAKKQATLYLAHVSREATVAVSPVASWPLFRPAVPGSIR